MFKDVAIVSAEKYYDYLKNALKGMDCCSVNTIKRKDVNSFVFYT